jgi:ribokinase
LASSSGRSAGHGTEERALGQVIVVGSVNADYVMRVGHLPAPGETVSGGRPAVLPGGKGANQAHAAARLGATVLLIAAIGSDAAGDSARADLATEGIGDSGLIECDDPTGIAVILVDAAGENIIAVAPGANDRLTAEVAAERLAHRVEAGTVILASLEIPLAAVLAAAAAAAAAGATLVVNPAPGRLLPPDLLRGAILTPNEGEILLLAPGQLRRTATPGEGSDPCETADASQSGAVDEAAAVAYLLAAGVRAVIVTRGGRGATLFRPDAEPADVPAPRVTVVDTVGAGDAFNGALVTALAGGLSLETAVAAAVQAGALACTGAGARQALPRAADIPELSSLD